MLYSDKCTEMAEEINTWHQLTIAIWFISSSVVGAI
jgi:hypothetical protein